MVEKSSKFLVESITDFYDMKKSQWSERTLWGIVLRDEIEDYPEYKEALLSIKKKVGQLEYLMRERYKEFRDYTNPKDFAFKVLHLEEAPILFALHKGQSIDEYFHNANVPFILTLAKKFL